LERKGYKRDEKEENVEISLIMHSKCHKILKNDYSVRRNRGKRKVSKIRRWEWVHYIWGEHKNTKEL
jgi:hypothetical protein